MKHSVHYSSASDNWQTPPELFAMLNAEFSFNLDAASTRENALCSTYLTEETNALSKNWLELAGFPAGRAGMNNRGAVWLNPPYSRGLQARFLQKARDEAAKTLGFVVCCLIPARPDTLIWHRTIFPCASEIRFLKGRVRFVGAEAGAPFPSAVVIFGQDTPQQVRGWDWRTNNFS